MDRKTRMEDDHEKYVRDANQQAREDNRHIERLKSQVCCCLLLIWYDSNLLAVLFALDG